MKHTKSTGLFILIYSQSLSPALSHSFPLFGMHLKYRYGDILPRSNSEKIYSVILQFIGAIVCAIIIGSLTAVISSMDTNARITAEELEGVSSFVEVRAFPLNLGKKVRRHFRHFYTLKSAIDESKILSELSTKLRKEVSTFLVSEIMGKESFFMTIPKHLWSKLLPLLRPMRFEVGEKAARAGDVRERIPPSPLYSYLYSHGSFQHIII